MWLDAVDAYRHLTPQQLARAMPRCPDPYAWARAFDDAIEFFGIRDISMLLAQVAHESAELTQLEESLYYTARRMTEVWPSRFPTVASAQPYARNPEALANNVYANRMGNGPPESGDGFRFAGKGPIQLTGRDNYQRFANAIDDPTPLTHPESLTMPTMGALSACWYYSVHVPNGADIALATQLINGGQHGMSDRIARYRHISQMLG